MERRSRITVPSFFGVRLTPVGVGVLLVVGFLTVSSIVDGDWAGLLYVWALLGLLWGWPLVAALRVRNGHYSWMYRDQAANRIEKLLRRYDARAFHLTDAQREVLLWWLTDRHVTGGVKANSIGALASAHATFERPATGNSDYITLSYDERRQAAEALRDEGWARPASRGSNGNRDWLHLNLKTVLHRCQTAVQGLPEPTVPSQTIPIQPADES